MKWFVFTAIILTGILITVSGSWGCQLSRPENPESVIIGTIDDIINALIYLADKKSFFTVNGVNVTIREYETGLVASDALARGEVDVAAATEFVIIGRAFQKEAISIFASHDKSQSIFLVSRKDRGIESIKDLKGKRIGLPRQTINEFYLGRLLQLNGLSLPDVVLIDIKPSQTVDAFNAGNIDAAITRHSFASRIKQQMGNGAVLREAQSDRPTFGIVAARNGWIGQNPKTVRRFLKALAQAEDYLYQSPGEAKATVQTWLKFDEAYLEEVWPLHRFSLSLDLSLFVAMNDEARWMIGNNLTTEKQVPDFRNHIYVDGLRAIAPEAVNIR